MKIFFPKANQSFTKLYLSVLFIFTGFYSYSQTNAVSKYNIIWTTPGINSQGSMPIGNGDIGANVWVDDNGDLVFYISKTDA